MKENKVERDFINVIWNDSVEVTDGLGSYFDGFKEISDKDADAMMTIREKYGLEEEYYDNNDYKSKILDGMEDFPKIITQFGTWAVTEHGIESLTVTYTIGADSLEHTHWTSHMYSKTWVNMDDFLLALYHGRKIHRYLQPLLRWKRRQENKLG